jgi:hypothetical protein
MAPAKTEDCPLRASPGEAEKPKIEKAVQIREKESPEAMEVPVKLLITFFFIYTGTVASNFLIRNRVWS